MTAMTTIYLKSLEIQNVGPLAKIKYRFPFSNGEPKPVVFVGPNGSGKSIVLAHCLSPLLSAQQLAYEDSEIELNKVYKLRHPGYIRKGQAYFYSKVTLSNGLECEDGQINRAIDDYISLHGKLPNDSFNKIPANGSSFFDSNYPIKAETIERAFDSNCLLYFPANRFEMPAWLNEQGFRFKPKLDVVPRRGRESRRRIIQDFPLSQTKNWLLDIVMDRNLYELNAHTVDLHTENGVSQITLFHGYKGASSDLWEAINHALRLVLATTDEIRFGVGSRRNRVISVMDSKNEVVIEDVFQLSTGQTSLLNFILSILRDYDATGNTIKDFESIQGVVIMMKSICTCIPIFSAIFYQR